MKPPLKAPALQVGGQEIVWGQRTWVMGILNVTPDSFSGDGLLNSVEVQQAAEAQGRAFIAAGADILDVGGESTRPNADPVSPAQELARVVPVVRRLAELGVLISIDTYKAEVAEAALQAGAHLINDVWGLHADPDMAAVAARYAAPVILMHNRAAWAPEALHPNLAACNIGRPYADLLPDVQRELLNSVALAHAAGIPDERILLDPGIGFGKNVAENRLLIDRLDEIRALGYPVLLGPSRKSFIGQTLDLPPDQRVEGTAAAIAVGIVRGADIVRVHDVLAMTRVTRMVDAIIRRNRV